MSDPRGGLLGSAVLCVAVAWAFLSFGDGARRAPPGDDRGVRPGRARSASPPGDPSHRGAGDVTTSCTFGGSLVDPDGEPVAGVTVSVHGLRAETDARGRFRVEGLPPGDHDVGLALPGHRAALLTMVRLPLDGEPRLTVSVWATLEGTVTDAATRAPVAGARVVVEMDSHAFWFPTRAETVADDAGRWRLRTFAGRRVRRVDAEAPGFAAPEDWQGGGLPATGCMRGSVVRVDVPLVAATEASPGDAPPADEPAAGSQAAPAPHLTLRGVVRAADGSVPHDAWVQATVKASRRWGGGSVAQRWIETPTAAVGEGGRFEVSIPDDAEGSVIAWRAGAAHHAPTDAAWIDLEPGRTAYRAEVVLARGRTVEGRILDAATGAGIAGASIHLDDATQRAHNPDAAEYPSPICAVSGPGGVFRAEHADPAWNSMEVRAPGFVPVDVLIDAGDADASGDIGIERAFTLRGRATYEDGAPAARVEVMAYTVTDGLPDDDEQEEIETETAADGSFLVEPLAAGLRRLRFRPSWELSLDDPRGRRFVEHEETTDAALPLPVEVVIPVPPRIRGRVLGADDAPVANAPVEVTGEPQDAAHPLSAHGWTDAEGRFDLPGPYEGTASVTVEAKGFRDARRTNVRTGTRDLVIRLEPR